MTRQREHETVPVMPQVDTRRERLDAEIERERRRLALMRASLHHNAGSRMVMGFMADHVTRLERQRDTLERTMTGVVG